MSDHVRTADFVRISMTPPTKLGSVGNLSVMNQPDRAEDKIHVQALME